MELLSVLFGLSLKKLKKNTPQKIPYSGQHSLCITFRNFSKVPCLLNSHAATESTAATYTERTIRK